jgi:hypothetical protein
MDCFTDVYKKARDVVGNQKFSPDWNSFLKDKCSLQTYIGPKGFDTAKSKAPNLLREKLAAGVKDGQGEADQLVSAATAASGGSITERAATLKFVRHVYLVSQRGGQNVWVYAPPKADATWVYDEIMGTPVSIKAQLDRQEEIFSLEERKWMSGALLIARKVAEDCKSKLAGGLLKNVKSSTKEAIKRWFMDEDCGDAELAAAVEQLLAGFKKIATACNSSTLVFTDYPDWRTKRDDYYGAAFRGGEGGGFPIIYLEGAFTRLTGNTGKMWLCAQTILHELSHHDLLTDDHRYDHQGLKPSKTLFPYAKAIENADSWGYFAMDLAGYLSNADRANAWK